MRGSGFAFALALSVAACKASPSQDPETAISETVNPDQAKQAPSSGPAKAPIDVPVLRGRVNDYAGLLTPEQETELGDLYAAVEKELGSQIALLTIESLHGVAIEDYSLSVANAWGLGRSGIDDGVLLTVALADKAIRIEVGYGLELVISDQAAADVIGRMVPDFAIGEVFTGIKRGSLDIVQMLHAKEALIGTRKP